MIVVENEVNKLAMENKRESNILKNKYAGSPDKYDGERQEYNYENMVETDLPGYVCTCRPRVPLPICDDLFVP